MNQKSSSTSNGSLLSWNLIHSWYANDNRFYHRNGGEPYQDNYWIDKFNADAPAESICTIGSRDDFITLPKGRYKVIWDCSINFIDPPCESPSANSIALQLIVFRMRPVENTPLLTSHELTQVNVCSNMYELEYDLGIEANFRCNIEESDLNFNLYAYNRSTVSPPNATNIKNVIVRKMEIYKKN